MNKPKTSGSRGAGRGIARWFWGGFITILLVGVMIAVFAAIRGGKQWAESKLVENNNQADNWTKVIQVTLSGGEAILIDSESVPRIRAQAQTWIGQRFDETKTELILALDQQTKAIFDQAMKNVPAFADWHYSLKGEYTRLLYAAFGDLPAYLSGQLHEIVFQPAGTAEAIDNLTASIDAQLADQIRLAAQDLQGMLTRLMRSYQVGSNQINVQVDGQWTLGTQLAERLEGFVTLKPQDIARQGLATSAGAVASAATAKKLGAVTVAKASSKLAGKASFGALASITAKLGLKSAAKAGGTLTNAGTGAASGAALCTGTIAGAPLAPGCALVGGALTGLATWLLVDKAVLETEELINREEFEQQLNQALRAQRDELLDTLKGRFNDVLQTSFKQIQNVLDHQVRPTNTPPKEDFVPALAK
jgi:hypothetical protein